MKLKYTSITYRNIVNRSASFQAHLQGAVKNEEKNVVDSFGEKSAESMLLATSKILRMLFVRTMGLAQLRRYARQERGLMYKKCTTYALSNLIQLNI